MTKLPIPATALEQHLIALGKTGAGKSSALRDIVEFLLDQGSRVIIVTAKSDWWGLKLAADGKHAGYSVVVFGGDHADMPLHHLSGKTMAELLGTGNRSAVLQMRDWMPGERTQFWIDFASNLFRLLKGKLYLVIDEVHNFAPKGKILDVRAGQMLHWSNKLASEARGIGITLVAASQRPAKVHNDFLTSCETLIAMRVTTKWDRDAVRDWIDGCGDPGLGAKVLATLAQMKRGDAWVWSPEIEFGPQQVHFPMFTTYDSFRPQAESEAKALKGWAEVNLDDVRKKLEHVVKEAESNDPAKLKARISELQKQLRSQPTVAAKEVKVADPKAIERALEKQRKEYERILQLVNNVFREGVRAFGQIRDIATKAVSIHGTPLALPKVSAGEIQEKEIPRAPTVTRPAISTATPRPDISDNDNGDITGPEKRILTALSQLRAIDKTQPSRPMTAGWAGYSAESSAFKSPLSHLKTLGLVNYPSEGVVELTQAGLDRIGELPPADASVVKQRILDICDGPQRKILSALLDHGKEQIDRGALAELSGYEVTSSAFKSPLSALRTKGFLDYPGEGRVKAAEWLFVE